MQWGRARRGHERLQGAGGTDPWLGVAVTGWGEQAAPCTEARERGTRWGDARLPGRNPVPHRPGHPWTASCTVRPHTLLWVTLSPAGVVAAQWGERGWGSPLLRHLLGKPPTARHGDRAAGGVTVPGDAAELPPPPHGALRPTVPPARGPAGASGKDGHPGAVLGPARSSPGRLD